MTVNTIIPAPILCEPGDGQLTLPGQISIRYHGEGAAAVGQYLEQQLRTRLQLEARVQEAGQGSSSDPAAAVICLQLERCNQYLDHLPHSHEGYVLEVSPSGVHVCALRGNGLFYGVQTLLQLLPSHPPDSSSVVLQCMRVVDAPRFEWRGALLDVGRHFFDVPFIRHFLDALALHKINRFHWHLTEDQGWRLEVDAYPRLTQVGAWRGGGEGRQPYGGFYTKQQVREVLQYAAERFIEVVPEIELPGHCCAALASYPQLSCTGGVTEVPIHWGVHEDVYCAGKEETFTFLEGVLREVVELFSSQYVHIGGDEVPKVRWRHCSACQERIAAEGLADESELQSWFIRRIGTFLATQGRRLVGWDEILEGGLAPGAVVMSWRGIGGGIEAARAGHQVIMSPTSHCYFDYRQSLRADEPGAWYAMLPLETVYAFDPVPPEPRGEQQPAATNGDGAAPMSVSGAASSPPRDQDQGDLDADGDSVSDMAMGAPSVASAASLAAASAAMSTAPAAGGAPSGVPEAGGPQLATDHYTLASEDAAYIIGGQANVWTEYISEEGVVEYMLLPRLAALAEAVWSAPAARDWQAFRARLPAHLDRLAAAGFRYRDVV